MCLVCMCTYVCLYVHIHVYFSETTGGKDRYAPNIFPIIWSAPSHSVFILIKNKIKLKKKKKKKEMKSHSKPAACHQGLLC